MASLRDLDRLGMTGLRTFAYVLTMPFAVAALLYGLFNVIMTLAISRSPAAHEWGALVIGAVAIPLALRVKRGAGKFKRVLAGAPEGIATLKLLRQTAGGVGMGLQVGYAWLLDGSGKQLAQLIVNKADDLARIREIVVQAVPHVNVVEETSVTRIVASA